MPSLEVLMSHTHWTILIPYFPNEFAFRLDSKPKFAIEVDNTLRAYNQRLHTTESNPAIPQPDDWVLVDLSLNLMVEREFVEDFIVFGGVYVILAAESSMMTMSEVRALDVGNLISKFESKYQGAGFQFPSTTNPFIKLQFPSHGMLFGVPMQDIMSGCEPEDPQSRYRKTKLAKFEWVISEITRRQQLQPKFYPPRFRLANGAVVDCPTNKDWIFMDISDTQREPTALDKNALTSVLKKDHTYLISSQSASKLKPADLKAALVKPTSFIKTS